MPFDLQNAFRSFQRTMDVIFPSIKRQLPFVYMNDILIFSKTLKEHIEDVCKVYLLLYNAKARLELRKCSFFSEATD